MQGDITGRTAIPSSSVDLLYLSTVFHIFKPAQVESFVSEVKRILKPGGTLAVVEIVKQKTPIGPPMEMRTSPEEMKQAVGLTAGDCYTVGEFFYMQLFVNG